jgi:hypothetical protein
MVWYIRKITSIPDPNNSRSMFKSYFRFYHYKYYIKYKFHTQQILQNIIAQYLESSTLNHNICITIIFNLTLLVTKLHILV